MAKERMINTRVWNDTWVSKLDPIEKLLFVYFLTNSYTNISGIYELPLKMAAVETGIDPSMFEKMLPHLEPKIIYKHGWVILPNFPKYQNTENPKIMTGIQRELASVPKDIHTLSIAYGYPIALNLTHTKPNLPVGAPAPAFEIVQETEREERSKPERRTKDKLAVYQLFSSKEEPWWRHGQQKLAALSLFDLVGIEAVRNGRRVMKENEDDKYCPQAATPFEYEEKREALKRYMKNNSK